MSGDWKEHTKPQPSEKTHECPLQSQTSTSLPAPLAPRLCGDFVNGEHHQGNIFYELTEELWKEEVRNLSFPLGPSIISEETKLSLLQIIGGLWAFITPGTLGVVSVARTRRESQCNINIIILQSSFCQRHCLMK